jgi:hypothetical protein
MYIIRYLAAGQIGLGEIVAVVSGPIETEIGDLRAIFPHHFERLGFYTLARATGGTLQV